jgi:hypothetical protein
MNFRRCIGHPSCRSAGAYPGNIAATISFRRQFDIAKLRWRVTDMCGPHVWRWGDYINLAGRGEARCRCISANRVLSPFFSYAKRLPQLHVR